MSGGDRPAPEAGEAEPGTGAERSRPRGSTVSKGRAAEERVARHLEAHGFELLARNVRLGRDELDLVARRRDLLVICEVRCRRNADYGHPAETIDRAKQQRIRRAAGRFVSEQGWRGAVRIDVATLLGDDPATAALRYIEAAF